MFFYQQLWSVQTKSWTRTIFKFLTDQCCVRILLIISYFSRYFMLQQIFYAPTCTITPGCQLSQITFNMGHCVVSNWWEVKVFTAVSFTKFSLLPTKCPWKTIIVNSLYFLCIFFREINTCDINPVHQLFAAGSTEVMK